MNFTDEDLKLLKDQIEGPCTSTICCHVKSLIARLEATEKLLMFYLNAKSVEWRDSGSIEIAVQLENEWRQSKDNVLS